nr:MAG TPA: hypothetical protein [Caudoviricetes sp.]
MRTFSRVCVAIFCYLYFIYLSRGFLKKPPYLCSNSHFAKLQRSVDKPYCRGFRGKDSYTDRYRQAIQLHKVAILYFINLSSCYDGKRRKIKSRF